MPGAIPAEMIANIRQPLSFIFLYLSYHVVHTFTSFNFFKKEHMNDHMLSAPSRFDISFAIKPP